MTNPLYLANDRFYAELTQDYQPGESVMYVTDVPANVPTIITLARGTANEAVFAVTQKSINSLTVTRLRGANVEHLAQTPMTCLNNEEFLNQYSGAVSTPETLKLVTYATDGGSSDDYAISPEVAPTSYVEGMIFTFKANTTSTGAATLNVNSLGAKSIKKNVVDDVEADDIKAGQIVPLIYDGTNFQIVGTVATGNADTLDDHHLTDIIDLIYPVGSIYISTISTNPGTLFGVGTWASFGAGKTLVGIDSGDTDFDTVEETGGEKTHTLTVGELATHSHNVMSGIRTATWAAPNLVNSYQYQAEAVVLTATTATAGSNTPHNNLQPYIVVYMWKRTA